MSLILITTSKSLRFAPRPSMSDILVLVQPYQSQMEVRVQVACPVRKTCTHCCLSVAPLGYMQHTAGVVMHALTK